MSTRRTVVVFVLAIVSLAACEKNEPETTEAAPQPSVVVITVDTLRADRLGCYGFAEARTPNIDRLAADGVRVERAIAATPITLPSHATLFTGLYPPAHGVRDNGRQRLPGEVETLAERLKKEGYRTQAFVSAMVLHRRFNLSQGFDGYDDELRSEGDSVMFMVQERSGEQTMDRVLAWMETSSAGEPFFLWVHLFDPHQPYEPPTRDAERSPTPYDGEIASADRQVGRLIDALKARGTLDDTVLVFTSDHGESLGEHGEATHGLFIYESTQHVPLIIRYPRRLPSGTTYDGFVRSVDVMPTVLGLAGIQAAETQGIDLADALSGRIEPPILEPYSESLHGKYEFSMAPLFGIRSERWTYVRAPRAELYDRATDSDEIHNLLQSTGPKRKDAEREASRLDRRVSHILGESRKMGVAAEASPLDDQTVQMLQALGYMDASNEPKGLDGMDPKDGVRAFDQLDVARALIRAEDFEGAKKVLRSLLDWIPTNASARNLLALCEFRTNDASSAKKLYLESLAYEPRQPEVLRQLSRIAIAEGDLETGRARALQSLKVEPQDVEAMILLAYLDLRAGHPEEAEAWYEKAIAADPSYPEAYLQHGNLLFRQRKLAAARTRYEEALERDPQSASAAIQAGLCALQTSDLDAAARFFETAIQIEPNNWKPHFNLACVHARRGSPDAAVRELTRAQANGLADPRLLQQSPCFQPLHPDPRFKALVRGQALPSQPR